MTKNISNRNSNAALKSRKPYAYTPKGKFLYKGTAAHDFITRNRIALDKAYNG